MVGIIHLVLQMRKLRIERVRKVSGITQLVTEQELAFRSDSKACALAAATRKLPPKLLDLLLFFSSSSFLLLA